MHAAVADFRVLVLKILWSSCLSGNSSQIILRNYFFTLASTLVL